MSSQPALTPVPNLSYRGLSPCVTSLHDSSFLILGGNFELDILSNVTRYSFLDHNYTTLANMIVPRSNHACATVNIDGKSFVVVAGGYTTGAYVNIDSSEIMDINENQWALLGPLQEKRGGAGMMVTSSGLLVIGGDDENFEDLQSIERWDFTNRSWVTTETKLEKGRSFFGITEIPASFFQCKRDIKPATTASTTEPSASTTEPEVSGEPESDPEALPLLVPDTESATPRNVCSGPPPLPQFGNWSCNSNHSRCHLSCSPGYLSPTTAAVKCQDGVWPKNSHHFCEPSVLFLTGGWGGKQDTEIITQTFNEEEALCQHTPPLLTEWYEHTSFYYSLNKEIFLCGGGLTGSKCSSITATATSWTDHALPSSIGAGVRSVIYEEEKKVIFVGGQDNNYHYLPATSLSLPMSSQPALTPVPNLSYRGYSPCVTSLHDSSFLILGGRFEVDVLSNVTRYSFLDHSYTTLANMKVPRCNHACATVNIDGKSFVVVAGGHNSDVYDMIDSSEIMDINQNKWFLMDPLKEKMRGAGMVVTSSGLLVIGGDDGMGDLQSIERWDSTNRSWVTTERKLEKGRRFFGITEIPASFFQCKQDIELGVNAGWSEYSEWSSCSQSCGIGMKSRSRNCTDPQPQFGGQNCQGNSTQTETCMEIDNCPVIGGWSEYSEWSSCSQSCELGIKSRIRSCTAPRPQFGGEYCQGNFIEIGNCVEIENCPISGGWSEYSEWNSCSQSCGIGMKSRSRNCTDPQPKFGGQDCQGNSTQTESCTETENCPVSGEWSAYSEWSSCSQSCGLGMKSRSRSCTDPQPQFGGQNCQGNSIQNETCMEIENCPINGGWSDYSEWSSCSQTCGIGIKSRTRSCTNPQLQFGGEDCQGNSEETEKCEEIEKCPVPEPWPIKTSKPKAEDCGSGFVCCPGAADGDNILGSEKFVQETQYKESFLDCTEACQTLYPFSNGITQSKTQVYKNGKPKCWCEFGESLFHTNNGYQTCLYKIEEDDYEYY